MDELLINAGIQDPAKRAKCGETMKDLMDDLARRAVEQSDKSWESRIPQLVQSVKSQVLAEFDSKLAARDERVEQKFAAVQAKIGTSLDEFTAEVREDFNRIESNVVNLTAETNDNKAKLSALQTAFSEFTSPSSQGSGPSAGHTGVRPGASRGSLARAAPTSHRKDMDVAKCEVILSGFGGHLAQSTIFNAYKAWAAAHLPQGTSLPVVKSKRIDESAKLVFESASLASTVIDALKVSLDDGTGLGVGDNKFKFKISKPFRQRRLNDHMGGVKYKFSKLPQEHALHALGLSTDMFQWEAVFDRGGQINGGKLFFIFKDQPQIVARLTLDAQCVGSLTSTDNACVFPSENYREAFQLILKEAESEANGRLRG